jgi:hypothetical protein
MPRFSTAILLNQLTSFTVASTAELTKLPMPAHNTGSGRLLHIAVILHPFFRPEHLPHLGCDPFTTGRSFSSVDTQNQVYDRSMAARKTWQCACVFHKPSPLRRNAFRFNRIGPCRRRPDSGTRLRQEGSIAFGHKTHFPTDRAARRRNVQRHCLVALVQRFG